MATKAVFNDVKPFPNKPAPAAAGSVPGHNRPSPAADVVREFDITTGQFVDGGFTIPEAKTNVDWVDENSLLVVTDYGPESLTTSGYGRIAKLWKRGTTLAQAPTVMEGAKTDVSVSPFSVMDDDKRWTFLNKGEIVSTRAGPADTACRTSAGE